MSTREVIRLPELLEEEQLVAEIVEQGHRLILKHPVAAQAAYRALVAEGRRYAETEDGKRWRARLEASTAVRRAAPLWESATLNLLESSGESCLPTQLIDLVAQAISHLDIERTTALLNEVAAAGRAVGAERSR